MEKLTKTPQDIELRLVEPTKGQNNVVEVDGNLYFKFPNSDNLYTSRIEVISDGMVIGELAQAPD